MNTEVILAVADALDAETLVKEGVGFNMNWYYQDSGPSSYTDLTGHNCGTVACIAGWTSLLFDSEGNRRASIPDVSAIIARGDYTSCADAYSTAQDAMDLDCEQADSLFAPYDLSDWNQITPEIASRVLRTLAETGHVTWPSELMIKES